MRNLLAGIAAFSLGCAGMEGNERPLGDGLRNVSGRRFGIDERIDDECLRGSRPVEAPVNPRYPDLTARVCLSDSVRTVDELRESCRRAGMRLVVSEVDAPHWCCEK